MNIVGLSVLALALSLVLFGSRIWALIGIMLSVLFLTQGQQIEFFGINLYGVRFVELAGFIRVVARREFTFSQILLIDKIFILLYSSTSLIYILRSATGEANIIGMSLDAVLCYFTFRGLLVGYEQFQSFLRVFALLLLPYTFLLLIEAFTKQNPFHFMGGIEYGSWMRDGRNRCQGSFRHPSLLGTLGATFLPLYIGLLLGSIYRQRAVLGICLCLVIVWVSNSGAPLSCVGIGLVGWFFWPLRAKMRIVRGGAVIIAITLLLVMKAPIWYLPARISSLSGGDGWHRSFLMDVSFKNIDKWWLAGMPIANTLDWFPYNLDSTGGADITNQFISFALTGGFVPLLLFIILLIFLYKRLGVALVWIRNGAWHSAPAEFLLWGLGVMLTVHIFNWLGITYFDQFYVILFLHLALIVNLSDDVISRQCLQQ